MTDFNQKYCIDTSSLLELRALDADVFSGVWDALSDCAQRGVIHAPHEVLREVTRHDDVVARWAKSKKEMFFYPDQALLDNLTKVQSAFKFYDPESAEPIADPFLVAHGMQCGCAVITQEKPSLPGRSKPKIPDACLHFDVRFVTISEFFREQELVFVTQKSSSNITAL